MRERKLWYRESGRVLLFMLVPLIIVSSFGCQGRKSEQKAKNNAVPVLASAAEKKTVPVQLRAIGNVEPYSTVGVKAQVGGELIRVHFKEGQDVNKGDLILTIDPRQYEAALKQAEATLARDTAQWENARQELRRYEELVRKGYVAQSQYDQVRSNAEALEAVVKADKAVVENARLQLSYCFIRSPVTGRTGSLMANEGNLIKANADSPIIVINQIQPVHISFSVPEQHLDEIRRYMSAGSLKVEALISKEDTRPEQGVLTFVDNAVDSSTGTIRLKATFANKEKRLWPGQFVNVAMVLAAQPDSIVVPSQAVQTGQAGQFVFVVKEDLTVELRPVVVARTFDGEAVIEKGLQSGEKVVTDGQIRLVPGAKVELKSSLEEGK